MYTDEPVTSGERGRFWLPQSPDTKVSGAIDFDPPLAGHIVLDGELWPTDALATVVHGFLYSGQRVTAIECRVSRRQSRITGEDRQVLQTLGVRSFVFGEHIPVDQAFDAIEVRLQYLRGWANVRQGWESPVAEEHGYSIRYEDPPRRSVTLRDGRIVTLETLAPVTTATSMLAGSQRTVFGVKFPAAISLEELVGTVASLQDLVSFATRRAVEVITLHGTCPGILRHPGVPIQRALELRPFEVVQRSPADGDDDGTLFRSLLFLAPDDEAAFGTLIHHWFNLEEQLDVMLDLFLSLQYNPPHHLENKVMNICQAAEGIPPAPSRPQAHARRRVRRVA